MANPINTTADGKAYYSAMSRPKRDRDGSFPWANHGDYPTRAQAERVLAQYAERGEETHVIPGMYE